MASVLEAAVLKHELTSAEVNEHEIKDEDSSTPLVKGAAAQAAVVAKGIQKGDSVQCIERSEACIGKDGTKSGPMGTVQSVSIGKDGKKTIYVHFDSGLSSKGWPNGVPQDSKDFVKISKTKHLEAANAVQTERKKFAKDAEKAFKEKVNADLKLKEAKAKLKVLNTTQTTATGAPVKSGAKVGTAAQIAEAQSNVTKQQERVELYANGTKTAQSNAKGELCDYRCLPNKHTWAEKCLWAKCDHSVCKAHCTAPAGWSASTINKPRCEKMCETSALSWTDKCSWKGCHGCQKGLTWDLGNCTAEVVSTTGCAGHCTRSTAAWADKCLWTKKCDKCSACTAAGGGGDKTKAAAPITAATPKTAAATTKTAATR